MSSVGQISLDLNVNNKKFSHQVDGIQKQTTKAFNTMSIAVGNILSNMLQKAVASVGSFVKDSIDKGSEIAELENVVNSVFTSMSDKVDSFSKSALTSYGLTEKQAKKMVGTFGAMSKSFGYNEQQAYSMSTALTGLAGDVASFYNLNHEEAYTKLKSVFTGETESLKELGVVMTQTALDEFALANGFGKTTSKMSEQEKVALRLAFVQNKLSVATGDFVRTQDQWANQTRILSGQFETLKSTIGQGLINVLTPVIKAINTLMGKLIQLANAFKSFTEFVTGNKSKGKGPGAAMKEVASAAENAAGATSGIEDASKGAAKAAKKAQKSLMGFDEINKLSSNKDKDKGSSGGSGSIPRFDNIDFGTKISDQVDKSMAKIDSLYGLGENIGKSMTKALNNIKWKKIYQGARNFGKGLADFLNGLISPELFGSVGKTIASALNTAIYAALSFGTTFDFKDFGKSIAESINKFFQTFDFKALAKTINTWAKGLKDLVFTTLKSIKWKDVLKGITDFIKEIDIETLAIIIGAVTIKKIATFTIAKTVLAALGKKVSLAIGSAIAASLGTKPVMTVVSAGFKALLGDQAAKSALVFMFPTLSKVMAGIGKVITSAFGGIALIIGGVFTAVKNFIDMFINGFNWIKEILMVVGAALAAVGAIILGAPALIAGVIAAIIAAIATLVVVIKDHWKAISAWFKSLPGWFNKNVIQPVKTGFSNMCSSIKTFFTNLWANIQKTWASVTSWFNTKIIQPVTNAFRTFGTNIKNLFNNVVQGIRNGISSIPTFLQTIKTGFVTTFQGIWKFLKGIINTIIGGVQSMVNTVIGGLNSMIKAMNKIKFKAPDWVPEIGGKSFGFSIPTLNKVSLPRLAEGGYIRANQPQPVIVGDNKRQGEIVSPEDKMLEIMLKALDNFFGKLVQSGYKQNTNDGVNDIVIPIYLDGTLLDEVIVGAQQRRNLRSGGR